ncbi:MAG: hypothetical protein IPM91_08640 [Bacteroidetes bacterium]|nr:hypothetical protein [Bacteroidota bacterium]
MKLQIAVILLILSRQLIFGQSDCNKAKVNALKDFEEGNYIFHSLEFQPTESAYLFVLREDYNIQWRFIDPDFVDYYNCYDSAMTLNLKEKYGHDFLKKQRQRLIV